MKQKAKFENNSLTGGKCDTHMAIFFEKLKMLKINTDNLVFVYILLCVSLKIDFERTAMILASS